MGRGDADGALADEERNLEHARLSGDPFGISAALALLAATLAERGELAEARTLVDELLPLMAKHGIHGSLVFLAPVAETLGVRDELALAFADAPRPQVGWWLDVVPLALEGDMRGVADSYAEKGGPTLEAIARLHAGRRFLEQDRREEGEVELEKALAFYRSVDATAYIAEIESLLAGSAQSESA